MRGLKLTHVARNVLVVVVLIIVPMILGVLLVGPGTPSGRNTGSATRVGHKVLALLYEELGYRVVRFERGLETPPREHAVFIALEPGPALLRADGRYARGLLDFVRAGNGALITLGPDTDHSAEIDDRDQLLGETARRALEAARDVEARAKKRARGEDPNASGAKNDSKPDPGDKKDTIDRPILDLEETDPAESWDIERLSRFLDVEVSEGRIPGAPREQASALLVLSGPLAEEIDRAPVLKITRPRVFKFFGAEIPKILLSLNGDPILFEVTLDQGKLWVLSEPRLLQNGAIGRAMHARLAVRIVEELARVSNTKTIYFEEFSHGGREAANIFELAVSTAAKWPLLQIVLVALAWIAISAGRRRSVVELEVPPRRSRHEVIDAMASLFLRSGDTEGAAKRLRALSRLRIARALGAPEKASLTTELALGIALRTAKNADEVRACLEGPAVANGVEVKELVESAERLRRLRTELDGDR